MKKTITSILTVVFALVFVVSGVPLIRYYVNSNKQKQVYRELSQLMEQSESDVPEVPSQEEASLYTTVTDPNGQSIQILREFGALYEANPDIVGWIRIEGTVIDYPVMYKPESKDFYLRKNFNGETATHGCLYIQETCSVFPQSDNLTVYGHNMRDGTMFGCLKKYQKKRFWEEHPVIEFNTLMEKAQYEIFAVFKTTASAGQGFKYHNFIDAADAEAFNEFVSTCQELSLYDTGITPVIGDKLITLSTCENSQSNGRLVIVARRTDAL